MQVGVAQGNTVNWLWLYDRNTKLIKNLWVFLTVYSSTDVQSKSRSMKLLRFRYYLWLADNANYYDFIFRYIWRDDETVSLYSIIRHFQNSVVVSDARPMLLYRSMISQITNKAIVPMNLIELFKHAYNVFVPEAHFFRWKCSSGVARYNTTYDNSRVYVYSSENFLLQSYD